MWILRCLVMAVSDVFRNMAFEGGREVAVSALEGLYTTVLALVRLQSDLAIRAVVAQRTLETTTTRWVHQKMILQIDLPRWVEAACVRALEWLLATMCLVRFHFVVSEPLLHSPHSNGFSPVCTISCVFRPSDFAKCWSQNRHYVASVLLCKILGAKTGAQKTATDCYAILAL